MNVIIHVSDALRADHVSAYGYERETTPVLDDLAADGILFEQCISPSTWTRPVAASILSGLYPLVHGTRGLEDEFHPPVPTLAEQFRNAGYRTIGVGSMPNMQASWGFDRGFEEYRDMFEDDQVQKRRNDARDGIPLTRAEDITRGFLDWLDKRDTADPFFGLLWSTETHAPYAPPEGFRDYVDPTYDGPVDGTPSCFKHIETDTDREHLRALYDGAVKYNDHCIGQLREELRRRGEFDDTLLICLSDHGDELGEHGQFGHGITPYDTLIHVPCIVRTPDETGGIRISEQISLVDLYPTLLDYVPGTDINPNVSQILQGSSFKSALEGKKLERARSAYVDAKTYETKEQYQAIRTPRWKYIDVQQPDRDTKTLLELIWTVLQSGKILDILLNPIYYYKRHHSSETELLYDLTSDPEEQVNVLSEHQEEVIQLQNQLKTWVTRCEELYGRFKTEDHVAEIDGVVEKRLAQLGYLDDS